MEQNLYLVDLHTLVYKCDLLITVVTLYLGRDFQIRVDGKYFHIRFSDLAAFECCQW